MCSGSDSTEALAALSWVCAAMRVGYKDGESMKGNDFNQLVIKSIISFKISSINVIYRNLMIEMLILEDPSARRGYARNSCLKVHKRSFIISNLLIIDIKSYVRKY